MNIVYRLRIPKAKEGIISYQREIELPLTSCPASWIDEINDMVYEIISDCCMIPAEWKFEEEPDYCWRSIELPSMEYIRSLENEVAMLREKVNGRS